MKILESFFGFQNTKVNEQSVVSGVQEIELPKTETQLTDINNHLKSLGVDPDSELGEALKLVDQAGHTIDADMVKEMKTFIDKVDGSTDEKMETVKKALDKEVGLSEKVLTLIHTALHESLLPSSVKNSFLNMTEGMKMKEEVKEMFMKLASELKIDNPSMMPSEISETISMLADSISELGIDISQLDKDNVISLINAFMNQSSDKLELDFSNSSLGNINQENTLFEASSQNTENTVVNSEVVSGKELESETKLESEKELEPEKELELEKKPSSIKDVIKFLENVEENIDKMVDYLRDETVLENDMGNENVENIDPNQLIEDFIAILQDNSNTFIVREVTEKIADITNEFIDFKRSAVNMLSDVVRNIEKDHVMTKEEKVEQLDKVIDKLDKVLLKSDITLYTDMKTEKKLLKFSSNLAEAKLLLQKGDMAEAKKIVDHVLKELDEIQFKPAKVKVMHIFNKKALDHVMEFKDLKGSEILQKQVQNFEMAPKTPRTVLDYMRGLGLNKDSEVLEQMGLNKNVKPEEFKVENNLRNILEKLNQETENKSTTVQAGEKMMNHLTGQQLGNKLESKSQTQTLFFNIPLKMQEEIKDLKLYVQSRKQNQKMDWENSSLYFAIQTKNFDEMGIRVTSVNTNVTITVLNDHEELKNTMEPMMGEFKNYIEDVGYKVTGVYYSRLTGAEETAKIETQDTSTAIINKREVELDIAAYDQSKGFDLKV